MSKAALDLLKTGFADALFVEENDIVNVVTEDAGGLILLQDDLVLINEYLQRGVIRNIEGLSYALGDHDASQIIDLSYESD